MSLPHLLSQTESENERHYGSSVQAEIDGCSISWYSDRRHTPALMYQNQAWAEYEYINERERDWPAPQTIQTPTTILVTLL